MELNINSPSYYKDIHGIDDEIYWMCRDLHDYMLDKKYSDVVDIIGICPIIAHKEEVELGKWKEYKRCEAKAGFADVHLHTDYNTYINADMEKKKSLMIDNILRSVKVIANRAKLDYKTFESDVRLFCEEHEIQLV